MSNDSSRPDSSGFPARGPSVPWGPVSATLFTLAIFLGVQIVVSILLMLAIRWRAGLGASELDSIGEQFAFVVLSDGLVMVALWLFLRRKLENIKKLGLGRLPVWKDVGLACLGYMVYFGVLIVGMSLAGAFTHIDLDQPQELGFEKLIGLGPQAMGLISLVLLPPIVEEVVFRGFLYTGMRKKLKFVWAALATSLLFAAPHLLASSEGLLWVAGLDTCILSFVLCYLREKTGALWAPMIVHAIKNSVAFVILLAAATHP